MGNHDRKHKQASHDDDHTIANAKPGATSASHRRYAGVTTRNANRAAASSADSDIIRAMAQEAVDRIFITGLTNAKLVSEATKKDTYLRTGAAALGPLVQSEVAKTLLQMFDAMTERIAAQNHTKKLVLGKDGLLPAPAGTKWSSENLAGITVGISPFHMHDIWQTFVLPDPSTKKATRHSHKRGHKPTKPTPAKKPKPIPKPKGVEKLIKGSIPQSEKPPKGVGGLGYPDPPLPEPVDELLWLKFVWELFKNWALAASRGIEEGAGDIAIHAMAAGVASMAMKVKPDSLVAPTPTAHIIKPMLESWRKAAEHKRYAARVQQLGIKKGLNAASNLIARADKKSLTKPTLTFYGPDGIRECKGSQLQCIQAGAKVSKPALTAGIAYLRHLKQKYKSELAIYRYFMKRLAAAGYVDRYTKHVQKQKRR